MDIDLDAIRRVVAEADVFVVRFALIEQRLLVDTRPDANGRPLWDGAVPLTDAAGGTPYGVLGVPGRPIGLRLLLRKLPDGS